MAQLNKNAIAEPDLKEYLETESDFSFELFVLKKLVDLGAQCEHGGTYTDSVTGKTREFDIRARVGEDPRRTWLAIECKNVREYFPVLVSCAPRGDDEAFHEVMLAGAGVSSTRSDNWQIPAMEPKGKPIRISGSQSLYPPMEMVGKTTSQVGRGKSDARIIANDAEIFEKWSQCLSSADDLAKKLDDEDFGRFKSRVSALIPVVVIPEGMLWTVDLSLSGIRCN